MGAKQDLVVTLTRAPPHTRMHTCAQLVLVHLSVGSQDLFFCRLLVYILSSLLDFFFRKFAGACFTL